MTSSSCRKIYGGYTGADRIGYDLIVSDACCRVYYVQRRGWYWRVRVWAGFFKGRGPYPTRATASHAATRWVAANIAPHHHNGSAANVGAKSATAQRRASRR